MSRPQQFAYVVYLDEKVIGTIVRGDIPPPVAVMKDILEDHFDEDVTVAEDWIDDPQPNKMSLAFQVRGYKPEIVTLFKTLLLP